MARRTLALWTRGELKHCFRAFIRRPFDLGSRPPSRERSACRPSPGARSFRPQRTSHSWCFSISEMGIERLIGYQAHLSASVSFPPFIFFPLHRGLRLSIRGPTHAPCHVLSSEQQPPPSPSQAAGAAGDRRPRARCWESFSNRLLRKGNFLARSCFPSAGTRGFLEIIPFPPRNASSSSAICSEKEGAMQF